MANYRVNLKYNSQRDADIIQRLEAQENKQDYIRKLILSDIAASALLGLQTDIEEGRTDDRIKFWEDHCPAAGDPEYDCFNCVYAKFHWTTGDQIRGCSLEEEWNRVKDSITDAAKLSYQMKTKLSSLYGQCVSLPEVNHGEV